MFLVCVPNQRSRASSYQAVVSLGHHLQTVGDAVAHTFTGRRSLGATFFFMFSSHSLRFFLQLLLFQ